MIQCQGEAWGAIEECSSSFPQAKRESRNMGTEATCSSDFHLSVSMGVMK